MTDKEILIKAIQKASENGYIKHLGMLPMLPLTTSADILIERIFWQNRYEIIFSRAFAEALWGLEYVDNRLGETKDEWEERTGFETNWGCHLLRYQYHQQQMVLETEPIKYLEKYL